jgi:purine-cytosine permease-like protein
VLALFISHGISFVQNYLLKREYAIAKPEKLMGSPYGRVVVMHIAILAGGFLTMAIGSPAPLLVILVVLKTVLDVNLHNREHKKQKLMPILSKLMDQ